MWKLSELLSEWAETTDMHGPKYIKDSPTKTTKYLWCFALFLSVSCMSAQFYQLLIGYVEEKTVTKVFYETVSLETEQMLQVVYCPASWLNFTKILESKIQLPVIGKKNYDGISAKSKNCIFIFLFYKFDFSHPYPSSPSLLLLFGPITSIRHSW